jgi:hypothetical protein
VPQLTNDVTRITAATSSVTVANVIANIQAMTTAYLTNSSTLDASTEPDLMLYVSPQIYAMFLQAQYNANRFALMEFDNNGDLKLPYFGLEQLKMHKTYGLTGTNNMIMTPGKNMLHIFDGVSDVEGVELWYEPSYKQMLYLARWRQGCSYWNGSYIVCNF